MSYMPTIIASTLGVACVSSAAPINFIHEGFGSGTLDGVAFSAAFTITAVADTSDRNQLVFGGAPYGWDIEHTSAAIDIDGLGSFDFITGTRTFVNNDGPVVGFSRSNDDGGSDLFNGPTDAAFAAWDMSTSIGPISGLGILLQWGTPFENILTTGGVLYFDHADHAEIDVRFTATIIPTPATLALLALAAPASFRRVPRRKI
jgi:hypothetical protein